MLDPLMALAGYSEYTFGSLSRIKEPFVRYVALHHLSSPACGCL